MEKLVSKKALIHHIFGAHWSDIDREICPIEKAEEWLDENIPDASIDRYHIYHHMAKYAQVRHNSLYHEHIGMRDNEH
jgi:hypothetical protein